MKNSARLLACLGMVKHHVQRCGAAYSSLCELQTDPHDVITSPHSDTGAVLVGQQEAQQPASSATQQAGNPFHASPSTNTVNTESENPFELATDDESDGMDPFAASQMGSAKSLDRMAQIPETSASKMAAVEEEARAAPSAHSPSSPASQSQRSATDVQAAAGADTGTTSAAVVPQAAPKNDTFGERV